MAIFAQFFEVKLMYTTDLSDRCLNIFFRSIPVNRLQQIIEVLESDIVVRSASNFVSNYHYF